MAQAATLVRALTSEFLSGGLGAVVISNPLHPKRLTIPSGVFIPGKDGTPVKSTSALQELVRLLHREHDRLYPKRQTSATNSPPWSQDRHLAEGCSSYEVDHTGSSYEFLSIDEHKCPDYLGSYLTIASCFWTWWRTQPIPKLHPDIRPYVRARKYVRDNAQCVNVPIAIIDDLILASRKAILQDTNSLLVTNGCYSIPTLLIHQMLEVVETCVEGIPFVSNDEANCQARGLGNMVAFWERMRSICPKVNIYHGPILTKDGEQCTTDKDLDLAMLATREFWFESPPDADQAWDPVLNAYNNCEPWLDIPVPPCSAFYSTLLHTKDSAPGPDGIPYSAWRLLPDVTVDALLSYFYDIVNGTALPPILLSSSTILLLYFSRVLLSSYATCLLLCRSFTLPVFDSAIIFLYCSLTLLFSYSTILLLYCSLTLLFFDATILWLHYSLTPLFSYSTFL